MAKYIISAGPTGNGNGNLDVWKNPNINNGVDNVSSTTWWNSGLSSENCAAVDNLINARVGRDCLESEVAITVITMAARIT